MVNKKLAKAVVYAGAVAITAVSQPTEVHKKFEKYEEQQQASRQTRELNSATRDKGRPGTSGKK